MQEFRLLINHLPYSELFPNRLRRTHWSVRSSVTETAKSEAYYSALQTYARSWKVPKKASVFYRFTVTDRRRRDLDNLIAACKPFLDGLVTAGILKDDQAPYLSIAGAEVVKGNQDKTELIIKEEV
jgi:Holliday junction resolvase RusA-like endonuclease